MKKFILLLTCISLTGCSPKLGPRTIPIDSDAYNRAVHSSTDRQILLNMVRLRYRDNPTFLQVGIISSAYEMKRTARAGFEFGHDSSNFRFRPEVSGEFNEKPTTTYSPVRGEGFVNEFLSPIQFHTLFFLNSAGWKLDRILRCCVQRLNNIRNAPTASGPTPVCAPEFEEFQELTAILHHLVRADAMHFVTQRSAATNLIEHYLVFDAELIHHSEMERIWSLLELDPGTYEAKLTPYHGKKHLGNEIMVQTRSPLSLMYFLSQGVHAPVIDELVGLVTVTEDCHGCPFDWQRVLGGLMEIHVAEPGKGRGAVVVYYRGHDFYIDDRDLNSKSTFSLLSQLLALQVGTPNIPVVTLPLVTQ